ncbi:MAG: hypothetical protein HY821_18265 [Acidobacteria bacterium]|nr:hypothetical protein [Acidobacteriota bacterium]
MPTSRNGSQILRLALLAVLLTGSLAPALQAQLLWNSTANYQYNVDSLIYVPSTHVLTVVFSVTNPMSANTPYNILSGVAPYPAGVASLRVVVGWTNNSYGLPEFTNTAAITTVTRTWMTAVPPTAPNGVAPAAPVSLNALAGPTAAKPCGAAGSPPFCPTGRFWMITTLPAQVSGVGRLLIEGHPSEQTGFDALNQPVYASVPVKTLARDFAIDTATPRRQIVEFNKCKQCHDDRQHGNTIVPRLSLHGANRNEEPAACVVCHNPNQTDAAYRASGAEQSVDFKRMVHSIHAGGFRKTPFSVVGFRGTVVDFSQVRFPSELRNCTKCHIDDGRKGTFELRQVTKLGSTINTGSVINNTTSSTVDRDPSNDLRISPIAATCSGCHDSAEVRSHMISKGASFGAYQSVLEGKEQCVTCHGPGRSEDVRRAHEIRTSGSTYDR